MIWHPSKSELFAHAENEASDKSRVVAAVATHPGDKLNIPKGAWHAEGEVCERVLRSRLVMRLDVCVDGGPCLLNA